ncbi:alpha/beta hydrolase [Pedobacter sp. LMG 31464]|uniref:Alpha/beta hydrolase n=1 Tax=Pedobacter planticolens TaxID=2679964 RepID=A0A923E2I2_9SPHI|nr:alpha/beta hydrolase-fold protein [Pedobacter planticolens]MBB2146272.1 alpha/beta hydrolase [Pedobacter planticolens]
MKRSLLIVLLMFIVGFSFAQKPFQLGNIYKIHSKILNEDRVLNIYTPEGYHPDSATKYPVIYLLDGSANEDFVHVVGLVQFLTMIEAMPKTIIVGIANIDRRRDFTYPTTIENDKKDYPTTGSSAKFIKFLGEELQPYIVSKFKTGGSKTIIGQSLGGLLATEILLKNSELFNNYIIVSPSLWWNNESLLKNANAFINKEKLIDTKVYIAVGEEGERMKDDAKQLAQLILQSEGATINLTFFEKEDHLTILHNGLYQTLVKMYTKKK